MSYTVLLVEDDVTQRMITSRMLEKKLELRVKEAANGKEALFYLSKDEEEIDVVLLDLIMPEMDGFEALEKISELYPNLPVIVLTGSEDVKDAVRAIKMGATDFLIKPVEPERLHVSVENALKINSLSQEVSRLRRKYSGNGFGFTDIIGHDSGLAEIIAKSKKAASSDIPVLINGETGTGKEVFARAIHGESKRFNAPFIAVNCAAIPENLVESTLFGHEKGAFTGAIAKAIGKFREAEGGTIFLDEIGELPLEAQAKLLRVLQQKEIEPVGAGHSVKVNVRIISATNRNLAEQVANHKFREDLLFRLNVMQLELPPLRKRKKDIIALAYHFLEKFGASEGKLIRKISVEGENLLLENEWKGNVRELENVLFRSVVMADGKELSEEDISLSVNSTPAKSVTGQIGTGISIYTQVGKLKTLEEIESEAIKQAIEHFSGNISAAAEALGVAKSTIYRKQS